MPVLESLFFGVLAVSILTSTYMVGLFIHRVRARRAGLDKTLWECFNGEEDVSEKVHLEESLGEPQHIVSVRQRRMHLCSTCPDLLVVPGTCYAAVILPMDVGADQRDLVQCRVYLN